MSMFKRPDPLADGNIPGQNPATPERLPGHTGDVESDHTEANEETAGGRPACLFEAGDMRAVTADHTGRNLPPPASGKWRLRETFELGVRQGSLEGINPEPVVRGLRADGYYVWRAHGPETHGTTS